MNVMLNGGRPPACIDCGYTNSTMCAEYTFDDNGFPVSFNTTTLVSHNVIICPSVTMLIFMSTQVVVVSIVKPGNQDLRYVDL